MFKILANTVPKFRITKYLRNLILLNIKWLLAFRKWFDSIKSLNLIFYSRHFHHYFTSKQYIKGGQASVSMPRSSHTSSDWSSPEIRAVMIPILGKGLTNWTFYFPEVYSSQSRSCHTDQGKCSLTSKSQRPFISCSSGRGGEGNKTASLQVVVS